MFSFSHERLIAILSRNYRFAAASEKGRKSAAVIQMKVFDDGFHTVLHAPVRASHVKPQNAQLSYAQPRWINAALLQQDAILKAMRTLEQGGETDFDPETCVGQAVSHDHNSYTPYRCPLHISRKTHADNVPSTFNCRLQWKARLAEIEVLAKQADNLCDAA